MDDLRNRFRRLDRIDTPDLWREVVARAAEVEVTRRRGLSLVTALMVAALLVAALAGAIAVGSWLQHRQPDWRSMTFSNGMLVGSNEGKLIGIDANGSEAREVASFGAVEPTLDVNGDMAWSSDGRSLVYLASPRCNQACPEQRDTGVWILDVRTGVKHHLAACPDYSCHGLDIAPDGSFVSYVRNQEQPTLFVSTADGLVNRRIDLPGASGVPSISPDGSRLAVPVIGGRSGIYVVDLQNLRTRTNPEAVVIHPWVEANNLTWSPNSEWLAFHAFGPGEISNIWVERSDGTDARLLDSGANPYGPMYPTWSADSRSVAYVSTPLDQKAKGQRLELWTVTIDGGQPTRSFVSECCIGDYTRPAWSPDGRLIALGVTFFGDAGAPDDRLMVLSVEGGGPRKISGHVFDPVWQPIPVGSG